MDRAARLSPLGTQRLRLLECLGGNDRRLSGYFAPGAGDIFTEFREYVRGLSARWEREDDPITVSLVAAARLLTGDLSAADVIVDHLPARATKLDHGAGICLVAPLHATSASLPLPTDLIDTSRWLAGSQEQVALRAWLAQHRDRLRWDEVAAAYRLDG
jgi:hypothetical protein